MRYLSVYRSLSPRIITTSISTCQMLQSPTTERDLSHCAILYVKYKRCSRYTRERYNQTATTIDSKDMHISIFASYICAPVKHLSLTSFFLCQIHSLARFNATHHAVCSAFFVGRALYRWIPIMNSSSFDTSTLYWDLYKYVQHVHCGCNLFASYNIDLEIMA